MLKLRDFPDPAPGHGGKLRAVVHTVLPLAEARQAHEMMEASEPFGKIVLSV